MAKISTTALNNNLRNNWVAHLITLLTNDEEPTVLQVTSGKIAVPAVDEEGNEKWVTITVAVPKGTRDGDEYDGYSEAESYQLEQTEKEEKRIAREKEKERKAQEREAKRAEKEATKKGE